MRRGDDLLGAPGDEVAGGLRDDAAGPDELVVLVKDQASPGKLVRGSLCALQTADTPE